MILFTSKFFDLVLRRNLAFYYILHRVDVTKVTRIRCVSAEVADG